MLRGPVKPFFPLLVLAALAVACSSDPGPQTPDAGDGQTPRKCVGGVILEDGTCVAKCDPSKCLPGNTCVDNKCTLECTAHSQCTQYTQSCLPAKEDDTGRDLHVCTNVPAVEYGDACPFGTGCADVCQSTGPGDSRSYCTMTCESDASCPAGFECGTVRVGRPICGTNKGNSSLCGTSSEPCITREQIAEPGSRFVEGQFCLEERRCLKRETCASCETDVDCSWGMNLKCARLIDGKKCLPTCGKQSDCEADKYCDEVSFVCRPKTDACTGNQFCSPCRYDSDCPTDFACLQLHGSEMGCIKLRNVTACTNSSQCPMTPSGVRGSCLQNGLCYAPEKTGTDEFGNQYQFNTCHP